MHREKAVQIPKKGGNFMEDCKIVELYLERNESAIKETKEKYDKYCSYIANNILNSEPDTETSIGTAICCRRQRPAR